MSPLSRRLSGLSEIESRGVGGTEGNFYGLGVIRVDGQVRRNQVGFELDRPGLGVIDGAAGEHLVGVQLELGTGLDALDHVLDHPVAQSVVGVGEVDGCATGTIGETGDKRLERNVLARGSANRGHVDFVAGDLEGPLTNLRNRGESVVLDLELVGGGCRANVGDVECGATASCRHLHNAGAGGVSDDVVGRASGDTSRQGAGAGSAGGGVDDTENNRVADLEVQKRSNGNVVTRGINIGRCKLAQGASRFVIQGTGSAGQNGGGHWRTRE